MLSRIAESLYWVGRYAERAEDIARILDVHLHHILEDPWVDEEMACQTLLGIMGTPIPEDGEVDAARVIDILAFDATNTCSILGALNAARNNARGARDAISSEMWECLNATYNALPGQTVVEPGFGPYRFFRYVKERAAVLAGLADSTMSRDDGWRFLVLGRSLERVDMTTRLLLATISGGSGSPEWINTLRSCSAYEAFLRPTVARLSRRWPLSFSCSTGSFPAPLSMLCHWLNSACPNWVRPSAVRAMRTRPAAFWGWPAPSSSFVGWTSWSPICPPTSSGFRPPAPRRARRWASASSAKPRPSSGPSREPAACELAHRHPPSQRLPLPGPGHRVLQRSPYHPAHHRPSNGDRSHGQSEPTSADHALYRLLGAHCSMSSTSNNPTPTWS